MDTSNLIKDQNGMIKTGDYSSVNANNLSPSGYQQALAYAQAHSASVQPGQVTGLPSMQSTSQLASTNTQTGDASSLLGFKDTLSQVINLAKEKRNAFSLGFMQPMQGTVAASDFTSILGDLNKASNTFSQDVLKNIVPTKLDTSVVEYGGSKWLINNQTGEPIKELGPSDAPGIPEDANYWANTVLNGNATMAQVPANLKNEVNRVLNTPTNGAKYSPLAGQRFATESNRIVNNFVALPQYQLTANGLPYLQRIDAAMKTPGSVSDQDLLDSLTKLNTAGNAITDAQVSIITHGKSWADNLSIWGNKLGKGGVLSTDQRNQIQTIAKKIFDNYKTGYQPVYDQVTSQLRDAGVPEAFWTIPNLNKLSEQAGGQNVTGERTQVEQMRKDNIPDSIIEQVLGHPISFNMVGNTTASIEIPTGTLAAANNNPGNLRFAGQEGATQGKGGFAKFQSAIDGFNALIGQIKLDASRGLSLASFINKFAPPSENDTTGYIRKIVAELGVSAQTLIAKLDINKLASAIARHESGTKIT